FEVVGGDVQAVHTGQRRNRHLEFDAGIESGTLRNHRQGKACALNVETDAVGLIDGAGIQAGADSNEQLGARQRQLHQVGIGESRGPFVTRYLVQGEVEAGVRNDYESKGVELERAGNRFLFRV